MDDRRRSPRLAIGIDAYYRLSAGDEPHLALIENLSREGVRLSVPEPLEPGKPVIVEFTLPSGSKVQGSAAVAWCARAADPSLFRTGLAWSGLEKPSSTGLYDFLWRREPETAIRPASPVPAPVFAEPRPLVRWGRVVSGVLRLCLLAGTAAGLVLLYTFWISRYTV